LLLKEKEWIHSAGEQSARRIDISTVVRPRQYVYGVVPGKEQIHGGGATPEIKLPGVLEKPEPRARDTTTRAYKCLYF
jgi:hypothetical protein